MPTSKRRKAAATRGAAPRRPKPRRGSGKAAPIEVALAALAHDIRTPLTGILSLSQLLEASDLPERERRWAATIRGTAEHLAQLTTIVVDAAKADAAGLVLRHEPFAPRELAVAAAASLKARAEAKGLGVDVSIPKTLPKTLPARVAGDPVRLRSALENLIDNAVKFTERGRVGFKVAAGRARQGRVPLTFTIVDSGIGITAADLKRLFKPFAQANEAVARRYGGAGLGLSFVRRIARAMGGDLDVESRPGRGSTFRLTVAVEPLPRAAARPLQPQRPLRVLCVEDNPYGRVVLKAILDEFGHAVAFVGTGEAAIEAVAGGGHDAVLMDVTLAGSGIDGFEAARRIRGLPRPAGAIPIVGLSGRAAADDAAAAAQAGMDAYLRKPAAPAELAEALSRLAASGPARPRKTAGRRAVAR